MKHPFAELMRWLFAALFGLAAVAVWYELVLTFKDIIGV